MKVENAFIVRAPIDDVWDALMDVERVAPCMPGVQVLEVIGDDTYNVAVKVRVWPVSLSGRGQLQVVERDEATRQVTLRASADGGKERGAGDARVHLSLVEQSGMTHGRIGTEVQLTGKAAIGQAVLAEVSDTLTQLFAARLEEMLASDQAGSRLLAEEAPGVADSSLPVGQIATRMIAARLGSPRTILPVIITSALVFTALRYAIRRRG
jgi:uncharacterized protein